MYALVFSLFVGCVDWVIVFFQGGADEGAAAAAGGSAHRTGRRKDTSFKCECLALFDVPP